jgi:hypothetical protein
MRFALPDCAVAALLLLASPLVAQNPAAAPRSWTDAQGRTMQATLKAVEGDQVVFVMASGQTLKFPISKLSPNDQAFVKSNMSSVPVTTGSPPGTAAVSNRVPLEKRVWPEIVDVPPQAVDIKAVEEKPDEKRCIYRSEAFEFISEDKLAGSVMKEIARTFEATRSLLIALPWGVDPKPPIEIGRFQAKFYETRNSYIADGGPPNSGGVYMRSDRIFRIPFQSLGLEVRGKTWFKNDNYRNDTIIHEITHQLMHDFLSFLPTWVIEGTAEYAEMLPYNGANGKFLAASHQRGFKEYLEEAKRRGVSLSDVGSVQTHMNMKRSEWDARSGGSITSGPGSPSEQFRLYFSSCVLVYYFCHLDGDGKGTRFLKYFDKVAEAREAWNAFLSSPLVKHDKETRRYSWNPSQISPPKFPQSEDFGLAELGILLSERTPEKLEADIKAGFAKIGVKW